MSNPNGEEARCTTPFDGAFCAMGPRMKMHMRTRVLIWCAPIALIPAPAHAQLPAQAAQAKTGVVATVSATGCVERWTPQSGDTAGKPPDGVQFVLTHIDGRTESATAAGGGTPE